jgi:DNA-binding GntR family transcriptional regulator
MNDSQFTLEGIEKVQRGPLREQISAQIKNLILTNRLRPGQAIVIDLLAGELGVSHTPVREALAMLAHEGLVRMKPYENPLVAEIDASDVREVWEMRILLEGWAIDQATLALSEEALETIEESLQCARQDALESRFDAHRESDIEMHRMIVQSTDHHLFLHLAEQVEDQSIRIRWLVEAVGSEQDVLTIVDEHCALLAALRARDPELARQRLIANLEAGMQRTLTALESIAADEE